MAIPTNARIIAIIAALAAIMQAQGCATPLTEEERYREEALRAERMDQIHLFIRACETSGNVVTYRNPVTSQFRDPLRNIPRMAQITDYGCVSQQNAYRTLW